MPGHNEGAMLLRWKKVQSWPRTGEPYSLRSVIIYREMGWMVQQHRNDLLCPEVLNSSTEFRAERKFRTVGVDSVTHNVLAVCLYYGDSVYNKM
jgi:hypothetical protein